MKKSCAQSAWSSKDLVDVILQAVSAMPARTHEARKPLVPQMTTMIP